MHNRLNKTNNNNQYLHKKKQRKTSQKHLANSRRYFVQGLVCHKSFTNEVFQGFTNFFSTKSLNMAGLTLKNCCFLFKKSASPVHVWQS